MKILKNKKVKKMKNIVRLVLLFVALATLMWCGTWIQDSIYDLDNDTLVHLDGEFITFYTNGECVDDNNHKSTWSTTKDTLTYIWYIDETTFVIKKYAYIVFNDSVLKIKCDKYTMYSTENASYIPVVINFNYIIKYIR